MTHAHATALSHRRRELAARALRAATETRATMGLSQGGPICVYDLCDRLGVVVRFVDIEMEGVYVRGRPPRILLSARRPLVRRTFTCAHELGHHLFGHGAPLFGSSIPPAEEPAHDSAELLVDLFAGSLLMPTIGLRRAFLARRWKPNEASPANIYCVACEYGVGYSTLILQLTNCAGLLSRGRAAELGKATPRSIREQLLGAARREPLIFIDPHATCTTIDAEVGSLVLLPHSTEAAGLGLQFESDLPAGRLFRAAAAGIVQVRAAEWAAFVRVAPVQSEEIHGYVGLAKYRHLEAASDD